MGDSAVFFCLRMEKFHPSQQACQLRCPINRLSVPLHQQKNVPCILFLKPLLFLNLLTRESHLHIASLAPLIVTHSEPSPATSSGTLISSSPIPSENPLILDHEIEIAASRTSDEMSSESSHCSRIEENNQMTSRRSKRRREKYRQKFKKQWPKKYPWLLQDRTNAFQVPCTVCGK